MAMDGGVSVNSGGGAGEGGGRRTGDSAVYGVGWGGVGCSPLSHHYRGSFQRRRGSSGGRDGTITTRRRGVLITHNT